MAGFINIQLYSGGKICPERGSAEKQCTKFDGLSYFLTIFV